MINEASFEARNNATEAISSGLPILFIRDSSANALLASTGSRPKYMLTLVAPAVSIYPGQIAFTLILSAARSSAEHLVN